jgi:hypothetical protein
MAARLAAQRSAAGGVFTTVAGGGGGGWDIFRIVLGNIQVLWATLGPSRPSDASLRKRADQQLRTFYKEDEPQPKWAQRRFFRLLAGWTTSGDRIHSNRVLLIGCSSACLYREIRDIIWTPMSS